MQGREVHACVRCRDSKRRCSHAGVKCYYPATSHDGAIPKPPIPSRVEALPEGLSQHIAKYSSAPSTSDEDHILENPVVERVVKKRNRAVLSCTRCHRLKVKCDKKQPSCGRCSQSGFARTCIYTHRAHLEHLDVQPRNPGSPFILAGEDREAVIVNWFHRKRGSSHWKALLSRLESLLRLDSSLFVIAIHGHMDSDCSTDLAIPGNFPFGSAESAKYSSMETIYALLQASRPDCQTYIDSYVRLYQTLYPLIDVELFQEEVENFWDHPREVNVCWVAQFLIILGLGALATDQELTQAEKFFYASEACLAKTPFMFRPTTLDLKTLCHMVIAKQIASATCWALDSCWNIMGLLVRLAVMMGIHQDEAVCYSSQDIHKERQLNRQLWTVIVYLDVQLSLMTGQSSLLPQDTVLTHSELEPSDPLTLLEDCWKTTIPESLPIICHVLGRVNSSTDEMTYREVLQYDLEIRQLMRRMVPLEGSGLLRMVFDIFFRRVLLCLHRTYALHEDAPALYPTSYWSSLECSLALLVHHREFSELMNMPENMGLVGRMFMLDFFNAALTASIHLLRKDAPLAATLTSEGMIPPRQTILETLRSCLEIFGKEKNRSFCFRGGCHLLTAVFKMIPGTSNAHIPAICGCE